jgi:hypothetical protein
VPLEWLVLTVPAPAPVEWVVLLPHAVKTSRPTVVDAARAGTRKRMDDSGVG